jgi:hypothetical protein
MHRNLPKDNLTSYAFESIMAECYNLKFKNEYTRLPISLKDSTGIVGFTKSGIVHTCYFPDIGEMPDEACDSQCECAKRSVDKLLNSAEYFTKQDMHRIFEFNLNVYEYKDYSLLKYLYNTQKRIQKNKIENPLNYLHISDDFEIHVVVPYSFSYEIESLTSSNQLQNIITKSKDEFKPGDDFKEKTKAIFALDDADELDKLTTLLYEHYKSGIPIMENLKSDGMDVYGEMIKLSDRYKNEIINTSQGISDPVAYKQAISRFIQDFSKEFKNDFSYRKLGILKNYFLTLWIQGYGA